MSEIELGQQVRDTITGFQGTAIGRAEYLHDVPSVLVASETKQAASDARWLAESRLVPAAPGATGFGGSS